MHGLHSPICLQIERHVAQAADAYHPHPRRGRNIMNQKRSEHRDPAAKQRTRLGMIKSLRQRAYPRPLGPHPVGKSTVTANDGALHGRAQMVISRQALRAGQATHCPPPQAHALAHLEPFCIFAQSGYGTDGFVPGNKWILRHPPLIIEHGEVRVTKPAM